jgi:hypothetical protein
MANYGDRLAPLVTQRLAADPSLATGGGLLGDQGQPIDPELDTLLGERALQAKELDQGTPYFQLQHMLNTVLMDAMRYPLKSERITVIDSASGHFPLSVVRGMVATALKDYSVHEHAFKLCLPHNISAETSKLQQIVAYIDPAGGGANADETAYAIGGFLNGNVYLLSVGGIPGGYDEDKLTTLALRLKAFSTLADGHMVVKIEKNMGFGAFRAVFTPVLRLHIPNAGIEDDLVTGQKELRIINTLEPVIGRGSLIVTEDAVRHDLDTCSAYAPSMRLSYSFFYQLAKISTAKKALVHDDRVDAVEGLVRHFNEALALDQKKKLASMAAKAHADAIKDPLGYGRYNKPTGNTASMIKRRTVR